MRKNSELQTKKRKNEVMEGQLNLFEASAVIVRKLEDDFTTKSPPETKNNNDNCSIIVEESQETERTYQVNKYISENETFVEDIIKCLSSKQKTLLIAPLGSGKSTFVFSKILDYCKANKLVLLICTPNVSMIEQHEHDYDDKILYTVYDKSSSSKKQEEYRGQAVIMSTPDSLPTASQSISRFLLVVDEAHEIYTTSSYRPKFKNILDLEEKSEAILYLTATPNDLRLDNIKNRVIVNARNKLETRLTLREINKLQLSYVQKVIEMYYSSKEYDKVIYFSNSAKTDNNLLAEALRLKDYTVSVLSAETKRDDDYKKIVLGELPDSKVIIHTSVMQAGVNINNKNLRICLIVDTSSRSCETVETIEQLIGRYRQNVKDTVLLMSPRRKSKKSSDYETNVNEIVSLTKRLCYVANSEKDHLKIISDALAENNIIIKDADGVYKANEMACKQQSYYCSEQDTMSNSNSLKERLESSEALNFVDARIVVDEDCEKEDIDNERTIRRKEAEEKALEEIETLLEDLSSLSIEDIEFAIKEEMISPWATQEEREKIKQLIRLLSKHNSVKDALLGIEKYYQPQNWLGAIDVVKSKNMRTVNLLINKAKVKVLNFELLKNDKKGLADYSDLNLICVRRKIAGDKELRQIKIYLMIRNMGIVGTNKSLTEKHIKEILSRLMKHGLYKEAKSYSNKIKDIKRIIEDMYDTRIDYQNKKTTKGQTKKYFDGYNLKALKTLDLSTINK